MILALAELGGLKGLKGEDLADFCRLPQIPRRGPGPDPRRGGQGPHPRLRPAPAHLPGQPGFPPRPDRLVPDPVSQESPGPEGRPPGEAREAGSTRPGRSSSWPSACWPRKAGSSKRAGIVRLPDFRIPLTAADEETLAALEDMVLSGELGSVTLDDIRAKFRLTPGKLQTLLGVLAERKKIVEGIDGFILHSQLARRDRPQDPRVGQAGADRRRLQGDDRPLAQVQHPPAGAAR